MLETSFWIIGDIEGMEFGGILRIITPFDNERIALPPHDRDFGDEKSIDVP